MYFELYVLLDGQDSGHYINYWQWAHPLVFVMGGREVAVPRATVSC